MRFSLTPVHLDNDEAIAECLTAALDDDIPDVLLMAIADVAKATATSPAADHPGPGREGLDNAVAAGAKPRYDTVMKVLRALGVQVRAAPASEGSPARANLAIGSQVARSPGAPHRGHAALGTLEERGRIQASVRLTTKPRTTR